MPKLHDRLRNHNTARCDVFTKYPYGAVGDCESRKAFKVCAVLRKYPFTRVGDLVAARLANPIRFVKWKKVRNLTVVTDHQVLRNNPNTIWNQPHKRKELDVSARRVRMMQLHRSLIELEVAKAASRLQVRRMREKHDAQVAAFKRRVLRQGRQWEWDMYELVQPSFGNWERWRMADAANRGDYEEALEEYEALQLSFNPPKASRRRRKSQAKKNPVPRISSSVDETLTGRLMANIHLQCIL
jgi:hypothetical protein